MVNWQKRVSIIALALIVILVSLLGCKSLPQSSSEPPGEEQSRVPKYVFLFIGDGMSFEQVEATALYLGVSQNQTGTGSLNFTQFGTLGCMETYDATSYIPDSASSGTAIACGRITETGRIGMNADGTQSYPSIAQRLKAQKGYKIGIVSTVYLNHATPAVFYAHRQSRGMYYEIGLDLIDSGFDYFGGGGLYDADNGGASENLYTLAAAAGYTVADTMEKAQALTGADGKAIVVAPSDSEDAMSVPYQMDNVGSAWTLADYVEKGIDVLDNDTGFFMMVESGKIDWACHANDANATVSEVLALRDAVTVALAFYDRHPNETLILVTGDHETGGMALGNAAMDYTIYPAYLQKQTMSFAQFNASYIPAYKNDHPSFDVVLGDIETVFGLVAKENATETTDPNLIMTDEEYRMLRDAYDATLSGGDDASLYGSCEPLTVTANHILNRHAGVTFSTYAHTAAPLPVYAHGASAPVFAGVYHATGLNDRLADVTELSD